MKESGTRFYVGCSGYYYPYWKNRFYPAGMQPRDWLKYYSTVFNTVELNGTFYRQPKPADLRKYYENTPTGFRFSVKVSKYITHVLKLEKANALVREFEDLIVGGLENKLGALLFQMPPSFVYNKEHLERVLAAIPHTPQHVIEFRHESWWDEEVIRTLRDTGITFCNVDFPGNVTPIVETGGTFYLRLHGNPLLFQSSYEETALEKFHQAVPATSKEVYVYFNNTMFEAGYQNAGVFAGIVNKEIKKGP